MNTDHAIDLSDASWRKSSFSGGGGSNCVEVAQTGRMIAVRDSKNPSGAVLTFTQPEWKAFTRALNAGRLAGRPARPSCRLTHQMPATVLATSRPPSGQPAIFLPACAPTANDRCGLAEPAFRPYRQQ